MKITPRDFFVFLDWKRVDSHWETTVSWIVANDHGKTPRAAMRMNHSRLGKHFGTRVADGRIWLTCDTDPETLAEATEGQEK